MLHDPYRQEHEYERVRLEGMLPSVLKLYQPTTTIYTHTTEHVRAAVDAIQSQTFNLTRCPSHHSILDSPSVASYTISILIHLQNLGPQMSYLIPMVI